MVTVVENVWINAAYKGSIHILYLDLVSLQVVQLPIDFLGALMLNKKLNMVFFVFFCFFFSCAVLTKHSLDFTEV